MIAAQYIGTIAKHAGVPIKTIRYYEDVGLLPKPARTASGYRLYDRAAVDRLQFIKKEGAVARPEAPRDQRDFGPG